MPQATYWFRVLRILYVQVHEGARKIHRRSRMCKGLFSAIHNCILLLLASYIGSIYSLQDQQETHKNSLHEEQLLHVVDDLCRFILHEVVHIHGQFVHPEHELSTDPKYASLRQWDNQLLRAAHSTPSVS